MSTKSSIRYEHADESGTGFHLYEETFEEENIYLELEGFDFESSSTSLPNWEKISAPCSPLPHRVGEEIGPAGRSVFKMNEVENLSVGELQAIFSGGRVGSLSPD